MDRGLSKDFYAVQALPDIFWESLGKGWQYFRGGISWPEVDQLNAAFYFFQQEWLELNDVKFVPQPHLGQRRRRKLRKLRREGRIGNYDAMIATEGKIWTRPQNWHDLFNALVWLSFPRSKLALHRAGFRAATEKGAGLNRSSTNDRLTIFDEGGVVLATHEDDFAQIRTIMVAKGSKVNKQKLGDLRTQPMGFGHGILEALTLQGQVVNALMVAIPLSENEWNKGRDDRLSAIDKKLAQLFDAHGTQFDLYPYISSFTVS